MSSKAAGLTSCVCGGILCVIGGIGIWLGWSSAAANLETWSVADQTHFQFECPNNESKIWMANETVALYRKDDGSGSCQKQFDATVVSFDKATSDYPADVNIVNRCNYKSLSQQIGNATSLEYVKFLARRLEDEDDHDAAEIVDDEEQETRGNCKLLGTFEFYTEQIKLENGTTVLACVVGQYSVKSDRPLWALSSSDKVVNDVVGILKVLLALFWFAIACGAGICCGCVGLCCVCCGSR